MQCRLQRAWRLQTFPRAIPSVPRARLCLLTDCDVCVAYLQTSSSASKQWESIRVGITPHCTSTNPRVTSYWYPFNIPIIPRLFLSSTPQSHLEYLLGCHDNTAQMGFGLNWSALSLGKLFTKGFITLDDVWWRQIEELPVALTS